ncbi:MAG: aminodeoxychorismate lyase, partial [Paenibacillus sp.]|nr:aminodeoxychorismate lyase [Paenibacillus sp.]
MASGKRLSVVARIGLTALILVLAGLTGLALYVWQSVQPMPASTQAVRVMIPAGSGSSQIGQLLEQQGLIRNARMFSYYLKLKEQGAKFQAGEYDMVPGMTLDAIIDMLNKGLIVKEQGIKLTVPEGFTVRQIADKASQQFGTDPALFMKAVQQ